MLPKGWDPKDWDKAVYVGNAEPGEQLVSVLPQRLRSLAVAGGAGDGTHGLHVRASHNSMPSS